MFVKQIKTYKNRVYIEIIEGFRTEKGTPGHRVVEKLGYLDELNEQHAGKGLEWAKQRAINLTKEVRPSEEIKIATGRIMSPSGSSKRNIGYLTLKPIYQTLEFDKVCDALKAKYPKIKCSLNDILEFLLYSKVIDADSKLSSYTKKYQYIDDFNFSEEEMYRCLEVFGDSWETIKDYAYRLTNEKYGVDLSITHYDGCNFYFEIDMEDELRRKGPSKEGRSEPIVGIGLLSDANMLPIDLKIYPGNESEKPHFTKVIDEMRDKNKITGRTIYVADRGLNTGNNIYEAMIHGDGYIYGQVIRGDKLENWALNDQGYKIKSNSLGEVIYKEKSWVDDEAYIEHIDKNGKKIKTRVIQKQIVFWSKDFAEKTARERNKLLNKAKAFIGSPKGYTRSKIGDAATFVKFARFDEKTGEYVESKDAPILDVDAINKQSRLDGYFMVVTSEVKMKDENILDAYSAQKGEERSFRVSKTYLKIRPVYVSREARIKCHVLISYLSLLMLKIMEVKVLKNKLPIEQIIDSIRDYEAANIAPNVYFFFKYNDYVTELATISNSNAKLETQPLSAIKKMFKHY